MATVSVRYIVDDAGAAIEFYCGQLGFQEVMHPSPGWAASRSWSRIPRATRSSC
ncbi:MAG TPA: VOC family protein [Solirubrobacteraceae bacterium]|jgi:catechol 2,3-dioxygenase-like lactoylglutathione lyase family enzyme|nr:VOC family protein [Solirubrobacteraceae bacterium]